LRDFKKGEVAGGKPVHDPCGLGLAKAVRPPSAWEKFGIQKAWVWRKLEDREKDLRVCRGKGECAGPEGIA